MKKLLLLFVVSVCACVAQTTQITDTMFFANGQRAGGKLLITPTASFTPSDGHFVTVNTITYTVVNGVVNVALEPTDTAFPPGVSYTVVFYGNDGSSNRSSWFVTTSGSPLTIAQVRSSITVLPTSVVSLSQIAGMNATTGQVPCWNGVRWNPCTVSGAGSILAAKGQILTDDGFTQQTLDPGADGTVLAADSTQPFGLGYVSRELPLTFSGPLVRSGNAITAPTAVVTTGTYNDPAWILTLNASKLTGSLPALTLPLATVSTVGVIKPGAGLSVDVAGVETLAYGSTANTPAQGNDSRIVNAVQTTTQYADPAFISNLSVSKLLGTVNSSNLPPATVSNRGAIIPGTGLSVAGDGTTTVSYGTSSGTAAAGNDARITGAVQTASTYSDPAWILTLSASKLVGTIPYTSITGLAPSASIDTTNAANVATGVFNSARIPLPTLSTVGGVKAIICGAGHVSSLDTTGAFACTPDLGQVGTLLQANNLSDLQSIITARTNLGLGQAATHPLTDFLLPGNNLSDLSSASAGRTALGLGTSATQPATAFLNTSDNLSDLPSPATARASLGLPSTSTQDASNASFLASGTVNSLRLPSTAVQTNGSATFGAFGYDFSGAATVTPFKVGTLAARPGTCVVGQFYYSTTSAAGSNVFGCTSSNVWTLEAGGGSSGGLVAANNLSDVASPSASLTNLGAGSIATHPTTDFLSTANNLTDLSSPSAARTALGLPSSVTVDHSNATNLTSGTVAPARLPLPASGTVGAVKSTTGISHQFLTSINTDGSVSQAQPAASDVSGLAPSATTDTTIASNLLSGTVPSARLPLPTAIAPGAVLSSAAPLHQFGTGINTSGVQTYAQPAASDITGLAPSATTDTTIASNLLSGLIPVARFPSSVYLNTANLVVSGFNLDASAASHSLPAKIGLNSAKPGTCTTGELYFATDLSAGSQLLGCSATNVWTPQNGGTGAYLAIANNLSDLNSTSAARTNLGLGGAALLGTAGVLQPANNLSEVNPSSARTNLGLGTASLLNTAGVLVPSNNLSEVSSPATARSNLGLPSTSTQDASNANFLTSGTVNQARLPGSVLQSGQNLTLTGQTIDLSGEIHTLPTPVGVSGAKPATCKVGELYFASDATSGANLYECASLNTWTQQSGAGGALLAANNLADVSSTATSRTNLGLTSTSTTPLANLLQGSNNLSEITSASTARTNLGLAPSSFIDTTNATNLTTGTLPFGRLPAIASTNLTDSAQLLRNNTMLTVLEIAAPSPPAAGNLSLWADSINGVFSSKNPAGVTTITTQPAPSSPHLFMSSLAPNGSFGFTQPSASDVTGLSASAVIDATNSSNQSSGTLPAARLPSSVVQNNVSYQLTGAVTADASLSGHTLPMKTGLTGSKPATCTLGEFYYATDASAGSNIYACTSANTWTLEGVTIPPNTYMLAANNLSDLINKNVAVSNLGLPSSVFTDTTIASNISSGVLPAGRMPTPTASTLGGVKSNTCVSGHLASLDTTGTFTCTADSGGGTATSINGTTVPTNSLANTVLMTTAPATGAWGILPQCLDSAGQHLNYDTTQHVFSCGTTGGAGSPTLASISYTQGGIGAGNLTALARLRELEVSVTDFQAKCDGTTNDDTAFNNAMAVATTVTVPPNVTCVVDGINVPSGVRLKGQGGSRLLKTAGSVADQLLNVTSATNVIIDNLTLDANGNSDASASQPYLVFAQTSTNVTFRNCVFQNTGSVQNGLGAILMFNVSGSIIGNRFLNTITGSHIVVDPNYSATNHVSVLNNISDGSQFNAIFVTNSSTTAGAANVEVAGNSITNVGDFSADNGASGNGIEVLKANNVDVHDNSVTTSTYSGVRVITSNFVNVHDNVLSGSGEVELWCGSVGGFGNHCHHNHLWNFQAGIQESGVAARLTDAPNIIENNVLTNGSDYGIHAEHAVVRGNTVDGVPFAIMVGYGSTSHNNTVQGNRIQRTSTTYPQVDIGVAVDTNLNTGVDNISDNTFETAPIIATVGGSNLATKWQVTGITKATNGVVSFTAGSAPPNGSTICFAQIAGMTQINGQCPVVNSTTFSGGAGTATLALNTTSYSTYVAATLNYFPYFILGLSAAGAQPYATPSTMLINDQVITYSLLGPAANGSHVFISDGTIGASCAGGGTGANATMIAGSWTCTGGVAGGGGGTPGGSSGQVQYNNAGAFAGSSGLTYANGLQQLTSVGGFIANGSGTGVLTLTDIASSNVVTLTPEASLTAGYTLFAPQSPISPTKSSIAQYSKGTPTIGFGTGAGTAPTVTSIGGNNSAFNIALTTGGTAPVIGTIATVTFSQAWTNAPVCQVMANGTPITGVGWTPSTTTLVITDTVALANTTPYKITGVCFGNP